ncbi:MAG TPA: hypothetical protein PLZ69_00340, partial [Candidatus Pacearchaeota archaeon]|nr:hypothetical protein [Candidatus Pacearchaeota archaeon]
MSQQNIQKEQSLSSSEPEVRTMQGDIAAIKKGQKLNVFVNRFIEKSSQKVEEGFLPKEGVSVEKKPEKSEEEIKLAEKQTKEIRMMNERRVEE